MGTVLLSGDEVIYSEGQWAFINSLIPQPKPHPEFSLRLTVSLVMIGCDRVTSFMLVIYRRAKCILSLATTEYCPSRYFLPVLYPIYPQNWHVLS